MQHPVITAICPTKEVLKDSELRKLFSLTGLKENTVIKCEVKFDALTAIKSLMLVF
jgi:hypothetical protein